MAQSSALIAMNVLLGIYAALPARSQSIDLVLDRGFRSDVTVPIGDLNRRSLEYPRIYDSEALGMDFSARVSNFGPDTATNVVVALDLIIDGSLSASYVSDPIASMPPGTADTLVIDADWDHPESDDVELVFTCTGTGIDPNDLNNVDTVPTAITYGPMSRAKGAYTGQLDLDPLEYKFVLARFEILEEEVFTCRVGGVFPSTAAALGADVMAVLLDEDFNILAEGEDYLYPLSDPGEESIAWILLYDEVLLQPGHDYYAGIEFLTMTDTFGIATQGTAPDSSVLLWDPMLMTTEYIEELPMINLLMGTSCAYSIPESPTGLAAFTIMHDPGTAELTLSYTLAASGPVTIALADLDGRQLMTAHEGNKAAGKHRTALATGSLAAGIYACTLGTSDGQLTRKVLVIR